MTNNKQQTAVEYYSKEIGRLTSDLITGKITGKQFVMLEIQLLEQAKEMEKEQITKAWKAGDGQHDKVADKLAEQYYEQTYGGNK
jgi:phage regulator Rha-like protein